MTASRTPRSATGARCELPGCGRRAAPGRHRVTVTVSGHAVVIERLCPEHRSALNGPSRRERAQSGQQRSSPTSSSTVRYRCHVCDQTWTSYTAAEKCLDSHETAAGGRISSDNRVHLDDEVGYRVDL